MTDLELQTAKQIKLNQNLITSLLSKLEHSVNPLNSSFDNNDLVNIYALTSGSGDYQAYVNGLISSLEDKSADLDAAFAAL